MTMDIRTRDYASFDSSTEDANGNFITASVEVIDGIATITYASYEYLDKKCVLDYVAWNTVRRYVEYHCKRAKIRLIQNITIADTGNKLN